MKEIYINPEYASFGYEIRLVDRDEKKQTVSYVSHIEMKNTKIEAEVIPPSILLNNKEIQSLMNELWRNGIRPTNQVDENGKIGIMRYHLEDMRRIVFKDKYKEGDKK